MFCPNCGKQIPEDSRFCEHCGSAINKKQVPSAPQTQATAPVYEEQPAKKKRTGISKVVMLGAAFAVIAAGVWFLKAWLDNGEPVEYAPNQKPSYTEPNNSTYSSAQNGKSNTEPDNNTSLPMQSPPPVQSGSVGYDVSGIEGIEDIDIEADAEYITRLFSTYDRPTMADFEWYDDVFQNGIWRGAKLVTELPYMLGGWKCCIVYDPYRNMDSYARELANVDITAVREDYSLTVDWYRMYAEGEAPYDESYLNDTVFTGSYENGEFYFTGDANITLDSFYEYEEAYYGFGSLLTPDGILADICLMR